MCTRSLCSELMQSAHVVVLLALRENDSFVTVVIWPTRNSSSRISTCYILL